MYHFTYKGTRQPYGLHTLHQFPVLLRGLRMAETYREGAERRTERAGSFGAVHPVHKGGEDFPPTS